MKGRNDTRIDMAAIAAFVVVLGVSALRGQPDRAYDQVCGRTGSAYGRMHEQVGSEDENGNPVSKADAYPDIAGVVQAAEDPGENPARPGREDVEILPDVTESQKVVLDEVMEVLEVQDLESAARVMDRGEEELLTLFYGVMDRMRYLYDGQSSSLPIEGKGLVLIMPKILYYGASKAGRLEGDCMAPQVVELDDSRYDYS